MIFAKSQGKEARKLGKEWSSSLAFWFRRQYNLSPNDERFLSITPFEMETDYWAHQYADKKVTESYEDEDFDEDGILKAIDLGELDLSEFDDVVAEQPSGVASE